MIFFWFLYHFIYIFYPYFSYSISYVLAIYGAIQSFGIVDDVIYPLHSESLL